MRHSQITMNPDDSPAIRLAHGVLRQFALLIIATSSALAVMPADLRCEYLRDPVGVDVAVPHLGWKPADGDAVRGQKQTAWHIRAASRPGLIAEGRADLWDSGVVESSQSVLVSYGGGAPGLEPIGILAGAHPRQGWQAITLERAGAFHHGAHGCG